MSDFVPSYITEQDVRNFFSPPLDYNDITRAEILLKIESVEKYVSTVYGVSASDARIPSLLLVAAKLIYDPKLSEKYYMISQEKLGDYSYKLGDVTESGRGGMSNPWAIAKSWEQMALDILKSKANTNDIKIYVVND
jgi:hypothetical protein